LHQLTQIGIITAFTLCHLATSEHI